MREEIGRVMDAWPTIREVLAAAQAIRGRARRTSLEHSRALSEAARAEVHLKLESHQRTGSFKFRGALNAVGSLTDAERERGLVTASAGNHGLGVALAAQLHGCPATIFVPAAAPATKRSRIARLGAALRLVEGDYDDAHAEAESHAREVGAHYAHAFSDPAVVAGQATVALEILQSLPATRTLVVPVGGGGLIGGMGIVARAMGLGVRVVGVQSRATAAMAASLAAGTLRSPPMGATLCDGLSGDIDAWSLALAREVVDEMVLVEEEQVRRAIRRLYVEEGVVAEGSGAVAAAAVYQRSIGELEGPVAVVISGGNIDASRLGSILVEEEIGAHDP